MRNLMYVFLFLLGGLLLPSCDSTEEPVFKPDSPTLNPQDSAIVMEIHSSLRMSDERESSKIWVLRHPDLWKGVTFEYDPQTNVRYVTGLALNVPTIGDSIPSSISGLRHLKSFKMVGQCKSHNGLLVPPQIFDCPLEIFEISDRESWTGEKVNEKLPKEIINVVGTLKSLTVAHSGLTELPDGFEQFAALEKCDLSNNHLSGKVPDYFGEFVNPAVLTSNGYREFNWDLFLQGKTIPTCASNPITNQIPDEILENHYQLFKERFWWTPNENDRKDKDAVWLIDYVTEWRKAHKLAI
ncbi:MAG: hypothetical protein K2J63_00240 [Muribaculaceae bacterium]|nr:hypothetical protein [Muribaculaceae bacterium]MDE6793718.1 hypothetical protein [Muribaculaceae bacterium]